MYSQLLNYWIIWRGLLHFFFLYFFFKQTIFYVRFYVTSNQLHLSVLRILYAAILLVFKCEEKNCH